MEKKISIAQVFPVLFTFFIMGFCDVVGISSAHVKEDFGLTETMANMIPVALFSMFLFFSIPTGMLMNKIGRKNTVLLSNVLTILALMIPVISYTFATMICAFMLLGVANTVLQVSLNPLLTNVVQGDKLTSSLTAGQFVKAVSSFCAPFVAAFAANQLGHWSYIFPIFAGVTVLTSIWLMATPTPKESEMGKSSSFGEVFGLLKDTKILLLFLGILFVVGVDVGTNTLAPKLLLERVDGMTTDQASYGPSYYFLFRTLGAFIGAFLLAKVSSTKFFRINIIVAVAAIIAMFSQSGEYVLYTLYAVVGFTVANVFSILFSFAIQHLPSKGNEISGLMITGIFGGAIITFLMGLASDAIGSQIGSVLVILVCAAYLLFCSFALSDAKK